MLSCAYSCLTLCDPMNCSPSGSSVHGDSPGKNTVVHCHALLKGIFPIQGSNTGFPHCRQILSSLSHQGSPYINYNKIKRKNYGMKEEEEGNKLGNTVYFEEVILKL